MNRSIKRFLTAVALVAASVGIQAAATATAVTQSQNLLLDRPFGADMARELILEQHAWQGKYDGWFGTFQVAGQYNRNWNAGAADGLGARPFWSGSNVMTVGSNASATATGVAALTAPANPVDLDAYQFGLGPVATTTTGKSITLAPVVYNAGADFLFFVGQHEDERGFWAKIHAPVGVAAIDPKLTEEAPTAVDFPAGAFNPSTETTPAAITVPYSNMVEAFAGGKTAGVFTGLQYGKINGKQTSSAKFGDIEFALGYNVVASESAHLGIALRASAPTANKPTAEYVFEPIFGRGGGWGLGGELFGHVTAWEGSSDNALEFWLDVQAMHMFKARQKRSFDLTNNPGSKYLLVNRFNSDFAAQNDIQQLINYSTLDVDATYGAVVDGALGIRYHAECWNVQIGYNFSGRTAEKLTLVQDLAEQTYGVIGRQYNETNNAGAAALTNLIQPAASINGTLANPATTNAQVAAIVADADATQGVVLASATNTIAGNSALDVTAAQLAAGWNSKIFANANYVFSDSDYAPTIGVLVDADFSTSHNNAVSKWGVGVFGGISF